MRLEVYLMDTVNYANCILASLSFSVQRAPGHSPTCYMSCESFYLEVCLEETGTPVSTKLVLGQEQQVLFRHVHI